MKTLEELLQYFGSRKAFNKKGDFTKKGSEAYKHMQEFLIDISTLTGIGTEDICRELDNICNENI